MNHEEMMKHIALPMGYKKPKMRGDIDGNAFSVLGNTKAALKRAGHRDIAKRLSEVALKGDYNDLLATCSACVEFVFPEDDFDEDDEEGGIEEEKEDVNPFIDDATNALVSLGVRKAKAKELVVSAVSGNAKMTLDEIVKKAISMKNAK